MAKKQARTEFQRDVDDVLTESINNNRQAREFILRNTARMAEEIESRFGRDLVQVYIKGKSSLKLKKLNDVVPGSPQEIDEETEWSDFDNQIIINPYIPRAWWYEIFNQIHCYIRDEYLPSVRDTFFIDRPDTVPKGAYVADHMKKVPFGKKIQDKIGLHGPETALKHAQKMQSNVLLCLGQEYLHPLNAFDNTRTVFGKEFNLDINFMKEKYSEANNFFPPSVIVLKDKNGKKVKKDSSVWMNCTIGKFLLYRLIVRYSAPGIDYEGKKIRDDVGVDRAKFRGEVIDISIPRRECEETINYWSRFKDDLRGLSDTNTYMRSYIKGKDKNDIAAMRTIKIPGWAYQLQENVMMLHEVLTYSSNSAHKFYKRLQRAWPALEAIQLSSEKDVKSPLHSNLFKKIDELQKHYDAYKAKPSIQSFYKQFGSLLLNDYSWDILSPSLKKSLLIDFLPTLSSSKITHQKDIEGMLKQFNVVEGSDDVKSSAGAILQDAFSVKKEDFIEGVVGKESTYKTKEAYLEAVKKQDTAIEKAYQAAKKVADEKIENYADLLKHLFIVNKSNQAFGNAFKLSMKQVELINGFRLALEQGCNLNANYWDEDKQSQLNKKELESKASSITTMIYGLGSILNPLKLLDGYSYDNFDQGTLSNKLDSTEPDALCYFCGILGSQLDLVGRMHLKESKDLEINYYFPVVRLYLKCSQKQWDNLKTIFNAKHYDFYKDYFVCRDKRFGNHVIQVKFINREDDKKSIAIDNRSDLLERQLVSSRVNDRLEINTLCNVIDEAYNNLEAMNSKLVIRKNELEAADKKDDKALEQVERYRNKLVEIYKSLLDIRNLLQTSESKGHTLDLQKGEADLQKYVDRAIELVNKIMSKKSTLSNFIGYKIEEADFTSFLEELLTLKKLITAIKLNPHMDLKDIQKQLNQYAVDYENGQETLIFARSNNDRNILINHHPYRILREQYINEYFHYYIGQLRDFYLLHWLDHERTQYKANITNFKTQLTRWCDQADSTVNH